MSVSTRPDTSTHPRWWYYDWTGTCSTSTNFGGFTGTYDTASPYYYVGSVYARKILVESPEHWAEDETVAFANLVNNETHTGWQVTMIIKGEVLITDPDIETRSIENFVPLLKKKASRDDIEKINTFFEVHPLVSPANDARR